MQSGGAMVLGKTSNLPGRPTNFERVGYGPTVLTVGVGGDWLDIFSLIYHFSLPCFWDIAWYRLKYSFKGPLNPKQPTNLSFRGNIGDQLFKEKNLLLLEQTLTFKSGHQCEEPPHAQQ